jgi:uncharacterized phage protein gp47/JayE
VYETQTESLIKQRMLDEVPSDLDKREGSFIFDSLSPAAIEMALLYIELDKVIKLGFAQTTYGQYLDYRAGEHGLTRLAATKATGEVTISGANGTTVAKDSVFSTGAGVQFKTTAALTIGETGQVTATIEAALAGNAGNVPAAAIVNIPVSIAGVTGATNASPTEGGTNTETDAALLERLLTKVREPATSGNVAHYKQWAREVNGVGDAKVFPIWNGAGTVKVVLIDSNKQPAGAGLVSEVTDYIEEVRPIGATVTVAAATGLDIDVSVTVTLAAGYVLGTVQTAFESALTEYLKSIAFKQDYVSTAQIGALILSTPGVTDYENLLVNGGGTSNIAVGNEEVAVKGTVTLSE